MKSLEASPFTTENASYPAAGLPQGGPVLMRIGRITLSVLDIQSLLFHRKPICVDAVGGSV